VVEELNVPELKTAHPDEYGSAVAVPNFTVLGPRLGKRLGPVSAAIKKLPPAEVARFQETKSLVVAGETLGEGDVRPLSHFSDHVQTSILCARAHVIASFTTNCDVVAFDSSAAATDPRNLPCETCTAASSVV
jgi:hypothetical protein